MFLLLLAQAAQSTSADAEWLYRLLSLGGMLLAIAASAVAIFRRNPSLDKELSGYAKREELEDLEEKLAGLDNKFQAAIKELDVKDEARTNELHKRLNEIQRENSQDNAQIMNRITEFWGQVQVAITMAESAKETAKDANDTAHRSAAFKH
jgi:seryl-tRNA synthetase